MNKGKVFENNWRKSVPDDVYYCRLKDNASMFATDAKYSLTNPYDCILFKEGTMFCLELKSTNNNRMSFEDKPKSAKNAIIHYHQIEGLRTAGKYNGICAGFVFNFRNDTLGTEITYFQDIKDFDRMISVINKHSFNVIDLLKFNPVKIESEKKRINYNYDIDKFIKLIKEKGE